METKYESLTLFEFQEKFPDNDSCQNFLVEMKWSEGFKCERCQNNKYCRGKFSIPVNAHNVSTKLPPQGAHFSTK